MAFTTVLITVSMVAIASAGFPGWDDDDSPFPGFPSHAMRFGPKAFPPVMPGMPTFQPNFPFLQIPVFPNMPSFPPMPTVADIANRGVPKNGESFSSVVIGSKMETKRDKDGKFVNDGGTTILTNENGVISMKQSGKNPPDLLKRAPPFHFDHPKFDFDIPKIKPSHPNHFENFNNFKKIGDMKKIKFDDFSNFGFRHTFIDPKEIETHVPGEGETYKGKSVRSHRFSSNINGQVTEGGSETRIDNDNGHVNKEKVDYSSDGTKA